ncbi:MAG: tRNA (uridine(34)/cytosine(34)/5-carboxymethylaminomethyluridine(34)-2'-O)-methyltransferase TrmL [Gammaproteobacteria bacterium]
MFHLVLYQPEIPPNTGNIIRLCANTGCHLHLIQPLGFALDDKRLKRAGLDYREYANVQQHESFDAFLAQVAPARVFGLSTKGRRGFYEGHYQAGDAFVFGPETRGLSEDLRQRLGAESVLRLPMRAENRSMNLSNSVAVVIYEAWRQCGFAGAGD